MARYFDVTFLTPVISLDAERKGQASFTVTNSTNASIRGDAVIVAQPGAEAAWLRPDRPSRHYPVGGSEQISVTVEVPGDVVAGTYGFKLRMLLGGGVPEEQFDDSEVVQFTVEDAPTEPPPPPPPPKPKFPWWLIAIGVVLMLIVVGAIIWWVFIRVPPLTGDDVRVVSVQPAVNTQLRNGQATPIVARVQYSLESRDQTALYVLVANHPNATTCPPTASWWDGNFQTIQRGTGEVTITFVPSVPAGSGRLGLDVIYYDLTAFQVVRDFDGFEAYCFAYVP